MQEVLWKYCSGNVRDVAACTGNMENMAYEETNLRPGLTDGKDPE